MLYRTTLIGDIPIGVDGFRSQIVEGEPFGAAVPTALKKKIEQRVSDKSKAEAAVPA